MCFCEAHRQTFLHNLVLSTRIFPEINTFLEDNLHLIDVNLKNRHGCTALHSAVMNSGRKSTERTVKILLKHGANPNIKNNDGFTALHYAIVNGGIYSTINTIRILLNHKADIKIKNKQNLFPVFYAVRYSKFSEIIHLLITNINQMRGDYRRTLIQEALVWFLPCGNSTMVKTLLNLGADPNECDYFKCNALHYLHNIHNRDDLYELFKTANPLNLSIIEILPIISAKENENIKLIQFLKKITVKYSYKNHRIIPTSFKKLLFLF